MIRFLLFLGYYRYATVSILLLIITTFLFSLGIGLTPGLGKMLFDKVFMTFDTLLLLKYTGIQLYIIIYLSFLTIIYTFFEANITIRISNKIKSRYLQKLLRSRLSFFQKHDTSFLVKRLIEDSNAIADGLTKLLIIFCNGIMVITIAYILFFIEKWLFILYTTLIGGSFIWMLLWMYPIHRYNTRIGNAYSDLYKLFWELLRGIREIKLQNLQQLSSEKIASTNQSVKNSLLMNTVFNAAMWQYAYFFYAAGYCVILAFGLQKIQEGNLSTGMLLGLLTLLFHLLDPVHKIYGAIGVVQAGITAAERIKVLHNAPCEKSGTNKLTSLTSDISFDNVSFSYQEEKPVLNNISLHIPRGTKTALVGKTGSGKSTIINLLLKLYGTYSGTISINGIDLNAYDNDSIRDRIVFISQDVQLYHDTIRNNIDFNRTLSDLQLAEIITSVNLDGMISRLKKGIDTRIGEDGINFSGGERQRIAAARCLALDPEVIVLDEVTSSLDPENEDIIIRNILQRFHDKTIISISHRKSTIMSCDTIYVLKQGEVIEQGTYDTLSESDSEFRRNFME